jgi:arsenate reductase
MMKILILCTGNSARSQMGEGLLRSLSHGAAEVYSAGTHPSRVNPLAIEAMKEAWIDISGHRSKSVEEFAGQRFDVVITVCDNARENCPIFPGAPERLHWSYPDPAAAEGSLEERLRAFREVRDDLRQKLQSFLDSHPLA